MAELLSEREVVNLHETTEISLIAMAEKPQVLRSDIGPVRLPGRERDNAAVSVHVQFGAYLPHWTCPGGIYAITFRLADSLPQKLLASLAQERDEIVRRAASNKRSLSRSEVQRLTRLYEERIEKFLNQGIGQCRLREDRAAECVRDALLHFDGDRYDLVVWCVMPNHVHVVVHPRERVEIAKICHSWKSFTANRINQLQQLSGTLWQKESYDHLIRDEDDYNHAIEYVLENPVVAGLKNWKWVGYGGGFQAVTNAVYG
ncbi:MAG: transposase [Pirellulales bacterium]|nr:transposase [Pirellulales bacterium]